MVSAPAYALDKHGVGTARLSLKQKHSGIAATFKVKTKQRKRFKQIVLAVRDSDGRNFDFAHRRSVLIARAVCRRRGQRRPRCSKAQRRRASKARKFTGFRTLPPGSYRAWVAYSLKGSRWVDTAPVKRFRIGPVAAGKPMNSASPSFESGPGAPPAGSSRLVFADEFNDGALDESKWGWKYPRSGDMIHSNWNNGEAQWYKRENVTEANGQLNLTAKRERTVSPSSGRTFDYSSGLIQSKPGFNFRYGYMEARMWLPKGSGFWPAFWTWPSNEQWPPEIDVMEFFGDNVQRTYQTYHYPGGSTDQVTHAVDWTAGWHTFAVDWRPDGLTWYVDGRVVDTAGISPNINMYLIANLALSNGERAPAPNTATQLPSSLKIDFIRVWQ